MGRLLIECAAHSTEYGSPANDQLLSLTDWIATVQTDTSHGSSIATYDSVKCPVGQFATRLDSVYKQGDGNLANRYWRFQCAKPNTDLGYGLDTSACQYTEWAVKKEISNQETPTKYNSVSCSSIGSNYVVTRMDITHKSGFCCWPHYESIRFQCCPLSASFVHCPDSTLLSSSGDYLRSASPLDSANSTSDRDMEEDGNDEDGSDKGDEAEEEHWVYTEPGESCAVACGSWGQFADKWNASTCKGISPGLNVPHPGNNRYCSWDTPGQISGTNLAQQLCLCEKKSAKLKECGCPSSQKGDVSGVLCQKREGKSVHCVPPNIGDALCPGDHTMCRRVSPAPASPANFSKKLRGAA